MSHSGTEQESATQHGGLELLERHYSLKELAGAWGVSVNTVKRMFQAEPDILKLSVRRRSGAQRRVLLRIPHSVAERVYRRWRANQND